MMLNFIFYEDKGLQSYSAISVLSPYVIKIEHYIEQNIRAHAVVSPYGSHSHRFGQEQ